MLLLPFLGSLSSLLHEERSPFDSIFSAKRPVFSSHYCFKRVLLIFHVVFSVCVCLGVSPFWCVFFRFSPRVVSFRNRRTVVVSCRCRGARSWWLGRAGAQPASPPAPPPRLVCFPVSPSSFPLFCSFQCPVFALKFIPARVSDSIPGLGTCLCGGRGQKNPPGL